MPTYGGHTREEMLEAWHMDRDFMQDGIMKDTHEHIPMDAASLEAYDRVYGGVPYFPRCGICTTYIFERDGKWFDYEEFKK